MSDSVLPPGFRFSQSALNDYDRCSRLFLLRHVKRLDWPAPVTAEAEAWETARRRGQLFHHLMHQDALGLDPSSILEATDDPLLRRWWSNYVSMPPAGVPEGRVFAEIRLSVPLLGRRLVAQFDRLILAHDGRIALVDWKTGEAPPDSAELESSWQTQVYRYVAVEGSAHLRGGTAVSPTKVVLIYWHAGYPDRLRPIAYSRGAHEESRKRLEAIAGDIDGREEAEFEKTEEIAHCLRCEYRSLCDRGRAAAQEWEIQEDDLDMPTLPDITEY